MSKYIKRTMAVVIVSLGFLSAASAGTRSIYSVDRGYVGSLHDRAGGGVDVYSIDRGYVGSIR